MLFGISIKVEAQLNVFTKIPTKNPTNYEPNLFGATEIDGHYFFLSWQQLGASINDSMAYTIHKTDTLGNQIDSLVITNYKSDRIGMMQIKEENGLICLYPYFGILDSNGYSKNFQLGRYRYKPDFTFVDSFRSQPVITPTFYGQSLMNIKIIDSYLIYNVYGIDSSLPAGSLGFPSNALYVIDTNGNFINSRRMHDISGHLLSKDFGTLNNQIIDAFNFYDSMNAAYYPVFFRIDVPSLSVTKRDSFPLNLSYGQNCYDIFPGNRFVMGSVKFSGWNQPDSFHVSIWDTALNKINQRAVPRTSTVTTYGNTINADLQHERFDGSHPNSIYLGTNWGLSSSFHNNSHFSLANLDSNLNVRWSKLFGGDFPYIILWYVSTSDGGCLIMGKRRTGNSPSDYYESLVFKISQQGVMTSIFSLADVPTENLVIIYPNPSNGIYTIKNDYTKAYQLLIFSQEGKVIFSNEEITELNHTVDISPHPSGLYYYRMQFSDGKTTGGKIVKKD